MSLQINSHFLNNSIVIIKSLAPDEEDTAKTLHDHLVSISGPESPRIEFYDALSKEHVFQMLDDVREKVRDGMKPIIHFETHGNKDEGLYIVESNEFISWQELVDRFREINVISNNNLGVVMAACFGLYAITPIRIFDPSPFFVLISSDKEIETDYINEQIWKFYDALFSSGSLDVAMSTIDAQFASFHAEKFFTKSVIKYFRFSCMGDAALERIDRLVSEVAAGIAKPTSEQLHYWKRQAEDFIAPKPEVFQRIAENFIIDKSKYTVTFEEIMNMVSATA